MKQHVSGTFEVTVTPEDQSPGPEGGVPTARYRLEKTFAGGLTGRCFGVMISGGTPTAGHAAAYVAIDQFHGVLDGRSGGFMLLHRGVQAGAGGRKLEVIVAEDSGTAELAGISGSLKIDLREGVHHYRLDYQLP
jgi:hypothetical protein